MKRHLVILALLLAAPRLAAAAEEMSPEARTASAQAAVRSLVADYNGKERRAFMKMLDDDFKGDADKLEDSLRRDFKFYKKVRLTLKEFDPIVSSETVKIPFHYELAQDSPYGGIRGFAGDSSFLISWHKGKPRLKEIGAPMFGQVSDDDKDAAARDSIMQMATAYTHKSRGAFMRLVSDDFRGNTATLEDALLSDFRAYSSVNLQVIIDNVDLDRQLANVDFHYNLSLVDRQGVQHQFNGSSEFTFQWEDGVSRLVRMQAPLIFANSLPASENPIAKSQGTSTTNTGTAPGAANAATRGSVTLGPNPYVAFKFRTQTRTTATSGYDIVEQGTTLAAQNAISDIGTCDLSTLKSVNRPMGTSATATTGHCYAILTTEGYYGAVKVTSISFSPPANTLIGLDYVFQASGTDSF
ncbi:MAG: hypothetical protein KGL53_15570 [Elusimicrobia bacterium]|nr:hypothetical protein [Elusimicrobiota bacterium]